MKVLVTGSAGFIGTHVVAALRARGDEVVESDPRTGSVVDLSSSPKLSSLDDLSSSPKLSSLDGIVHLGAITDTLSEDAAGLILTNVDLPKSLWVFATRRGIPLVYASSASVYGQGENGFDEEALPSPVNRYAQSKLAFDRWAISQAEVGQAPLRWAGLRFFNVYGPGEEPKGRMASMVSQAILAREHAVRLRLYEWGDQRRDFVFVEDVVDVVLWSLEPRDLPAAPSGIYNVGSGRATSFAEVARTVGAEVEWISMPKGTSKVFQSYTLAPLDRLRRAGYGREFRPVDVGVCAYEAKDVE